jgi:hypothetical protein
MRLVLKHTKTRLSTCAVPLQAVARAALDRLPPSQSSLLLPNARGRHIDFRSFGRRHWQMAVDGNGFQVFRGIGSPPGSAIGCRRLQPPGSTSAP